MQASVRILLVVAVGATLALMLLAGAPAALAYYEGDGSTPTSHIIKAWNPQYSAVQFARKGANEGGPVELPHPVDPPPDTFSANPNMNPGIPTGSKPGAMSVPGALPTGRGAGAILDAATRAEHSIQQVIRKLR